MNKFEIDSIALSKDTINMNTRSKIYGDYISKSSN